MWAWTSRILAGSYLKEEIEKLKAQIVRGATFKHQAYLFSSKTLYEIQAQIKNKSQAEIDNFFAQKQVQLKNYFGEQ